MISKGLMELRINPYYYRIGTDENGTHCTLEVTFCVCTYAVFISLRYIYIFQSDDEEDSVKQVADGSQQRFVAHVPVPSQQDIEQALLRRRKQELLEKYGVQENQSMT